MNAARAKMLREYVGRVIQTKAMRNKYYKRMKERWEKAGPLERKRLVEDIKADRMLRPPPVVTPRVNVAQGKAGKRRAQRARRAQHAG